jgi:hypothetical protein
MANITSSVSDGVTIRKAEGILTASEIINAIEKHSPSLSTSKVIWDFTNAFARDISSSDLKNIAEIAIEKNSHRPAEDKTALIFSSEFEMDLGQQVGKYLETLKLPYKLEVFTDMHDALLWLYTDDVSS